jgi:hypothetical protein
METSLIPLEPATTGGLFVPKTSTRFAAFATLHETSEGAVMNVQAGCCAPLPVGVLGASAFCPLNPEPSPLWSTPNAPSNFEVAVLAKLKSLREEPVEFEKTCEPNEGGREPEYDIRTTSV